MELSTAMRFVMVRAQAEAVSARNSTIIIEHIFLGLLKLSELTADEFASASRHKEQINADIGAVRTQLSELEIDSSRMRSRLRHLLHTKVLPGVDAELEKMLAAAGKMAALRRDEDITAAVVLAAILDQKRGR